MSKRESLTSGIFCLEGSTGTQKLISNEGTLEIKFFREFCFCFTSSLMEVN